MSIVFPNNTIKFDFFEIRRILYEEDGRTDLPYEKDYECYKPHKKDDEFKNQLKNLLGSKEADMYLWEKEDDNPIASLNKNSLIKISRNKSASDYTNYRTKHFDYKSEPNSFDKDFIKLPINTTEITNEIDFYFYDYSFSDNKDMFQKINAPLLSTGNYLMWQSDFLYMLTYLKFEAISDNYQLCLKRGRQQFQLSKKTDEENILHRFIKYYKDILNSNDKQLKIFDHIKTTKEVADLYTNILIEFLTLKLEPLLPETDKPYIVDPVDKETERGIDERTVYELPEDFSLTEMGIKSQSIDIRQTAVLFYYLRKHKATIDYSDKSFSKLIYYLTGHSANNLRQKSGFGNIVEILKSSKGGVEKNNLKQVKGLLESILHDIDKEIDK